MTNLIHNFRVLDILLVVFGLSISSGALSQNEFFNTLKGVVKENGSLSVGVTINIKGTLIQTTSQENGDFEINRETNGNVELIINPCCTDFCSSTIVVENNVSFIEIDCVCKKGRRTNKSKIIVLKQYEDKGEIKEKKDKYIICK